MIMLLFFDLFAPFTQMQCFFTNDVLFYQGYIVLTLGVIVKDDEKRNEQEIKLESVIFCQVKAPLLMMWI